MYSEIDAKTEDGAKRHWQHKETLEFLRCYAARKKEFLSEGKNQIALKKVLEDLKSCNVLTEPTTTKMLANKFKSLVLPYKRALDSDDINCSVKIPFRAELDEIFETNMFANNGLNISEFAREIDPLHTNILHILPDDDVSQCDIDKTATISFGERRRISTKTNSQKEKRKRYEQKLILKQQYHDAKEYNKHQRHKDKMEQRERFIQKLMKREKCTISFLKE